MVEELPVFVIKLAVVHSSQPLTKLPSKRDSPRRRQLNVPRLGAASPRGARATAHAATDRVGLNSAAEGDCVFDFAQGDLNLRIALHEWLPFVAMIGIGKMLIRLRKVK